MADMSSETEKKIQELQMIEQRVHNLLMQKQQFQGQLMETEAALTEMAKSKETYKIIGNIMVKTDKAELKKELEQKKDTFSLRVKTIEKQENSIKEQAKKMQEDVMKEMKN